MKLKVLMISTVELTRNGITTCINNLAGYLNTKEYQVDILESEYINDEVKMELEAKKCKIHCLASRKANLFRYFFQLVRVIRKERYDIVHVHGNSSTMAIELFAAIMAGCRVRIAHSHNTTCEHMKAHKLLLPFFQLICNGRCACGNDAGRWLYGQKEFLVIKNGIECSKYLCNSDIRNRMRKELGVYENEILLGHVGAFNYQKNHAFLLDFFSELLSRSSKYKLICLGEGEFLEEIKNFIHENKMNDKVYLPGSVSNVEDYLQAMDLFVLPSRFEGLPFVLIEAQASGLPCIVSTNVSIQADVSGNLVFLPLEKELWCEKIENNFLGRFDNQEKLEKAGYDIKSNGELLTSLYQSYFK